MRKSSLQRRTPMKRTAMKKTSGARQASTQRSKPLTRGKPLRKVNPEREAKRRKRYSANLAAYRRSETYKIVEARACGQCEAWDRLLPSWEFHCDARRADGVKLTHHHLSYARFGGKELPEDVIVLCPKHNAEAESLHPTRKRGRAA